MPEDTNFSSIERTRMPQQRSNYINEIEAAKTQTSLVVPPEFSPKLSPKHAFSLTPGDLKPDDLTPIPPSLTMYVPAVRSAKKRSANQMQVLRTRCRQIGVSIFFN